MPSTTRLSIPYPSGSTANNFASAMQSLATAVDSEAAIDLQGLASARPAAGTQGGYYFATDTGVLARDNGSSWDIVRKKLVDWTNGNQPTLSVAPGSAFSIVSQS